jgi:tetratricopeptide (TPR) repeat protein
MTLRFRVIAGLLAGLLIAGSAWGNASPPTPPPSTPSSLPESRDAQSPREEAELSYASAYEEIGKAKKDLEKGKTKSAEKRFRKALDHAERATQLDDTYFEAWNLVGYAARNLADYERSLAAYDRCLKLKFDYAPAREYLGETHLAMGNLKGAREQLGQLERLRATEEHANLKAAIDAWVVKHPEAKEAEAEVPPPTAASPDTSSTKP